MSDMTLFDLEVPEWVPVWETSVEDFGWTMPGSGLPLKADGTTVSKAEWRAYIAAGRCRDCGVTCPFDRGGAGGGQSYRLCEGCAQLDGCKLSSHTTVVERRPGMVGSFSHKEEAAHCSDCGWWTFIDYWGDEGAWVLYTSDDIVDMCAEHETPRWRSRWGSMHEVGEHDRLVAGQAKRRAEYLKAIAA